MGDLSSGIGLINFDNFGTSLKNIAAGYLTGGGAGAASAIGAGRFTGSRVIIVKAVMVHVNLYGVMIQALKETTKSNLLSTPSIVHHGQ